MKSKTLVLSLALSACLLSFPVLAAEPTKADAEALVKKAIALVKADGPEKAFAQISDPKGPFVNGELYVAVDDINNYTVAAHGVNPKYIGKDMSDATDADGKFFVKEKDDRAKKEDAFWTQYKVTNPVTKKLALKDTYCEKVDHYLACAGVFQQ